MKYAKPALSMEEQASLLIERGMGGDKARIQSYLEEVNYYRLAAYWHPFREQSRDDFIQGTHIDEVWDRYLFDRRLRILVMDAVERFEVSVRTRLAYELSLAYGPFGIYESNNIFADKNRQRVTFLSGLYGDIENSQETFMVHFRERYGDQHEEPPIWMAVETLSFGKAIRLYQGCSRHLRGQIAGHFQLAEPVMKSWLLTINTVRNICAHHGRLWNRTLAYSMKMPRSPLFKAWRGENRLARNSTYTALTSLSYILAHIAPSSSWARRLNELIAQHPTIPLAAMGFPSDWQEAPVWKAALNRP